MKLLNKVDTVIYERAYLESAAEELDWIMANWPPDRCAWWARNLYRHAVRLMEAESR